MATNESERKVGSLPGSRRSETGLSNLVDRLQGRRRLALLRDKIVSTAHRVGKTLLGLSKDLKNRVTGAVAEAEAEIREPPTSNYTLAARIKTEIGRLVAHPREVKVSVNKGLVTLRGKVQAKELAGLLEKVKYIPGVNGLQNKLRVPPE